MTSANTAAVAVGATAALISVGILKSPLWAGILVGAAAVLVTKNVIQKA